MTITMGTACRKCGVVMGLRPKLRPLMPGSDPGPAHAPGDELCEVCSGKATRPYVPPPIREHVMDRAERRDLDGSSYRLTPKQARLRVRKVWRHALDVTLETARRVAFPPTPPEIVKCGTCSGTGVDMRPSFRSQRIEPLPCRVCEGTGSVVLQVPLPLQVLFALRRMVRR